MISVSSPCVTASPPSNNTLLFIIVIAKVDHLPRPTSPLCPGTRHRVIFNCTLELSSSKSNNTFYWRITFHRQQHISIWHRPTRVTEEAMDGLVIARQLKYDSKRPLISLLYLQPIRNLSFALTRVECVSPRYLTKLVTFTQFLEIMYGKSLDSGTSSYKIPYLLDQTPLSNSSLHKPCLQ